MFQRQAAQLIRCVQQCEVDRIKSLLRDDPTSSVLMARLPLTLQASLVRIAIKADQPEVLDLLLSLGFPSHSEPYDGPEGDEEEIDRDESTPLCLAVNRGLEHCVNVLLAHGASVDVSGNQDGFAYSALHVAAMYEVTNGDIHKMLTMSANHIDALDFCENTPLHLAAAYGSYDVACALIAAGADVNARNGSGSTPLHLASPNGYDDLVELLLYHGADVEAVDALSHTPLVDAAFVSQSPANHYACGDAASQSIVITLLLNHGANADATNRDGDPVIAGALRNGFIDAVQALLDHGACLSKPNMRKETVLHVAARASIESAAVWKRLLQGGADVQARDRSERTCYDIWTSRPKMVVEEQPEDRQADGSRSADRDDVAVLLRAAIA